MKQASINIETTFDIHYSDHLDLEWMSDRFGSDPANGDPRGVGIMSASSRVREVRAISVSKY